MCDSHKKQRGGPPTAAPIPPDARYSPVGLAAASASRPPANPSRIKEPTSSYAPGGITPPGARGSAGQVTLLPDGGGGGGGGDFAAASDDGAGAVEFAPMGPTSRGGVSFWGSGNAGAFALLLLLPLLSCPRHSFTLHPVFPISTTLPTNTFAQRFSQAAPNVRIVPRPAERAIVAAAAAASSAPAAVPVAGPGAVKAAALPASRVPAATLTASAATPAEPAAAATGAALPLAPVAALGSRRMLRGGRSVKVDATPAPAPAAVVDASSSASANSSTSTTSASLSAGYADAAASPDGAAAAARAAAFSAREESSNATASAAAASFVNVTHPDGSWSASWANASAASWAVTSNYSWSAAWAEANASAAPAAPAAPAVESSQPTEPSAGADDSSGAALADGSGAGATAAARRLAAAADTPSSKDLWLTAPPCRVAAAGPNTVANVTRDPRGRFWGFQGGASCSFKGASAEALRHAQVGRRLGGGGDVVCMLFCFGALLALFGGGPAHGKSPPLPPSVRCAPTDRAV